ncbi:hypothetical protein PAPYR_11507 [Paratrimastix pyriformis]|uniref:Uncharacterized protein n=1 Tax=Paratrimastix pyriformis TaxID=342808 RepID=A0ABQ8U7E1_9EUKA|nr:hypothetical protein PAPYR_11507 [Paratrimastix pyriformis]
MAAQNWEAELIKSLPTLFSGKNPACKRWFLLACQKFRKAAAPTENQPGDTPVDFLFSPSHIWVGDVLPSLKNFFPDLLDEFFQSFEAFFHQNRTPVKHFHSRQWSFREWLTVTLIILHRRSTSSSRHKCLYYLSNLIADPHGSKEIHPVDVNPKSLSDLFMAAAPILGIDPGTARLPLESVKQLEALAHRNRWPIPASTSSADGPTNVETTPFVASNPPVIRPPPASTPSRPSNDSATPAAPPLRGPGPCQPSDDTRRKRPRNPNVEERKEKTRVAADTDDQPAESPGPPAIDRPVPPPPAPPPPAPLPIEVLLRILPGTPLAPHPAGVRPESPPSMEKEAPAPPPAFLPLPTSASPLASPPATCPPAPGDAPDDSEDSFLASSPLLRAESPELFGYPESREEAAPPPSQNPNDYWLDSSPYPTLRDDFPDEHGLDHQEQGLDHQEHGLDHQEQDGSSTAIPSPVPFATPLQKIAPGIRRWLPLSPPPTCSASPSPRGSASLPGTGRDHGSFVNFTLASKERRIRGLAGEVGGARSVEILGQRIQRGGHPGIAQGAADLGAAGGQAIDGPEEHRDHIGLGGGEVGVAPEPATPALPRARQFSGLDQRRLLSRPVPTALVLSWLLSAIAKLTRDPACLSALGDAGMAASLVGLLLSNTAALIAMPTYSTPILQCIDLVTLRSPGTRSALGAVGGGRSAAPEQPHPDVAHQLLSQLETLVPTHPEAAKLLLEAIAKLNENPKNCQAFGDTRVAAPLVELLMGSPTTIIAAQAEAARALFRATANLCWGPECLVSLCDAGLAAPLVELLRSDPASLIASPTVAFWLLTALNLLAICDAFGGDVEVAAPLVELLLNWPSTDPG